MGNILHEVEHDGFWNHVNHCSLDDVVVGVDKELCCFISHMNQETERQENLLITSTSIPSRSDKVPDALRIAGGASMAAIFFLFFEAKKLPKKPPFCSPFASKVGLAVRAGVADCGMGFPVLGSTWTGFAAFWRSLTMAMACLIVSNGMYTK